MEHWEWAWVSAWQQALIVPPQAKQDHIKKHGSGRRLGRGPGTDPLLDCRTPVSIPLASKREAISAFKDGLKMR